ncbi:hypothetical protein CANCADRAFT_15807, partial [Tortispora caseinolytica NRRL Y-17796]
NISIPNDIFESFDINFLRDLGYDQELLRVLDFKSLLGTGVSNTSALPGILLGFTTMVTQGGHVGLTWGFGVAAFFMQLISSCVAEICSEFPAAGGIYFAAACLAPKSCNKIFAWITGWSSFFAQASFTAAANYSLVKIVFSLIKVSGVVDSTSPMYNQHTLVGSVISQAFFFALMLLCALATCISVKNTTLINNFGTVFNFLLLVILAIMVPYKASLTPNGLNFSKAVTNFDSISSWNYVVAFMISFSSAARSFTSLDAPLHMSEETVNASAHCARSVKMSTAINFLSGIIISILIAVCLPSDGSLFEKPDVEPIVAFFLKIMDFPSAVALISLACLSIFLLGLANMASSARASYAYARDGVLPKSPLWKLVSSRTFSPYGSVVLLLIFGLLFGICAEILKQLDFILMFGAIAQLIAFAVAISMRLYAGNSFNPQNSNLGKKSMYIHSLCLLFIALMIPIWCLPHNLKKPYTAFQGFNYAPVLYSILMIIILVWYAIDARKWYNSP